MQEEIIKLAYSISSITREKVDLIETVMSQTKILALNAKIEAARAGDRGAAFGVVATEIGIVSSNIKRATADLRSTVDRQAQEIERAGTAMTTTFLGTRLSDLAHNAIEIIDRNLYERSCDVRWWATDGAVVAAAASPRDQPVSRYAQSRLATILRSYTVYLDLWVIGRDGVVIANGRPDRYPSVIGRNVSTHKWFVDALATQNGDDYAVGGVERNPLLENTLVATYATAVRAGGELTGRPTGVLAIFFDWNPQARAVLDGISLSPRERIGTRAMLLDADGWIIASSDNLGVLEERINLNCKGERRGFYSIDRRIIAFAATPGYETYKGLGWFGVIDASLS